MGCFEKYAGKQKEIKKDLINVTVSRVKQPMGASGAVNGNAFGLLEILGKFFRYQMSTVNKMETVRSLVSLNIF